MLATLLKTIGGGAFTGIFGSIVTVIGNFKMKKLELEGKKNEYAHRENMIDKETEAMIKESEAKIEIQREETRGEVEKAEIDAFSKSLETLKVSSFKESYMERLEKAGKFGSFAIVIISLAMAAIDVLKGTMRPVLTYFLVGTTTWNTWMAYRILKQFEAEITQQWAQDLYQTVVITTVYLTVSCVTWWFCDRRMAKFLATHIKGGAK